jgi:hypothetical protein
MVEASNSIKNGSASAEEAAKSDTAATKEPVLQAKAAAVQNTDIPEEEIPARNKEVAKEAGSGDSKNKAVNNAEPKNEGPAKNGTMPLQNSPQKNIESELGSDKAKGSDFKAEDAVSEEISPSTSSSNAPKSESNAAREPKNDAGNKVQAPGIKEEKSSKTSEIQKSGSLFAQMTGDEAEKSNEPKEEQGKPAAASNELDDNKPPMAAEVKNAPETSTRGSKEEAAKEMPAQSSLQGKAAAQEGIANRTPESEMPEKESKALQNRPQKNIDSELDADKGKGNDFKAAEEVSASKAQIQKENKATDTQKPATPVANKIEEEAKLPQKEEEMKGQKTGSADSTEVSVKNEKVAKELSKLTGNDEATLQKANISKEELETSPKQKPQDSQKEAPAETKKSLLDKLIEEPKKPEAKAPETQSSKSEIPKEAHTSKEPLLTNIYMSSQRKSADMASMQNATTAREMAKNAKGVEDIKKSADMLELDLQDTEISHEKSSDNHFVKDKILDRLAFTKGVMSDSLKTLNDTIAVKSKESAQSTTVSSAQSSDSASKEHTVELNVSNSVVHTIQSRIIGARQAMGSFMSDVARSMYQNYKPPVTAFRMNLNPANLGHIAVVMKSEKDNGISISLSMSNGSTLDSFLDNQAMLRAALAKTFNDAGSFALSFGMQQGNSSGSQAGTGSEQSNSGSNTAQTGTETITADEEQNDIETSNYM